jgi:hypothetical protein
MNFFDFFCENFGWLSFIGNICHDRRSKHAKTELEGFKIGGGSRRTRRTRRNRKTKKIK